MARILEMVYTVHRRSWIPEHNRPLVWFEVMAGHSPRDYQAENYSSAQRIISKHHTQEQADTAAERYRKHGIALM